MNMKNSGACRWLTVIFFACLTVFFTACGKKNEPDAQKRILCTTYPVYLFVKAVADGCPIQPELLLPADTGCPHDYSLTPRDLMRVTGDNVLLLQNGQGLDNMICSVARKTNPKLQVVDLSADAHDLLKTEEAVEKEHEEHAEHAEHEEHADHAEHEGHHHHHHAGSVYNPHLFASPDTARIMVKNAVKALVSFDADHAALYEKNGAAYLVRLDALSNEFRNAGLKGQKIAVQHNIFAYLARLTGMDEKVSLHAEESQALSPAAIAKLRNDIRQKKVTALLAEPQYSREIAEIIAREAGIRYIVLDPCASGPEKTDAGYYIRVMQNNLRVLQENFANE